MFSGNPQSQGLLAAAAQILQASGPSTRPTSFGQILGSGLGAYQQQEAQARQTGQAEKLRGLQIQGVESDLAQQQSQIEKQARIAQAAQAAQGPDGFDQNAFVNNVAQFDPMGAMELRKSFAKAPPKFDSGITFVNGPNGKPVAVRTADDGSVKQLDGLSPREKLELENLGGRSVAVNPYELQPGQAFQRTMSPDAAASNAIARENLGISRQRLAIEKQAQTGGGRAPGGYRWAANGNLEPIPGGPATKHATASEGERKASTLLQRLQFSEAQLEAAVKDAPGAATPSLLAQGLRGVGAEAAANSLTGESRQKVDAAQLDILDAALTLGTGAAYTKEQLEGYRKSYFPQIGDAPGTVKDKQARLNNVIEAAKTAAGRAAPAQPSVPAPSAAAPAAAGNKTVSLADITATARASGRSTKEVTAALRAKGYTIGGQ